MLAKTMKLKPVRWEGSVISKPGIYSKIPLAVYHRQQICDGPSVSSSGLRTLFSKSPAHFYESWSGNPDYVETPDKAQFILGRAVHHLILGEDRFSESFCAQPTEWADKVGLVHEWRRGQGGALFADKWRDEQTKAGRAILTPPQIESIRGMAVSLSKHPIVRAGALNGLIEHSIMWKDKTTGLWIKVRPDAIPTSSVDFVDLKTTTSVLWPDLQRTIFDFGYHQQGALVRLAARHVLHIDNPTFSLVFVENVRPHCVRVVTLKDSDLDRGERQNRTALDTVARCIKSKHWPGPGGEREDAEHIELPEYAQKQIDEKLEFGIA